MNPNQRGAIAEAAIALEAVRQGVEVFKPLSEHSRADLVFGVGTQLLKVQCKSGYRRGEVIRVGLVSSWHSPAGYVRNRYEAGELDLVAAHCPETATSYLIPFELVAGTSGFQLRLSPPKNSQRAAIHYAADFEFAGAVAQLGERRAGSAKATGSSPVSSTPPTGEVQVVGAHQFRNRFGFYMERAEAGEEILVTRRGRPTVRLVPHQPALGPSAS